MKGFLSSGIFKFIDNICLPVLLLLMAPGCSKRFDAPLAPLPGTYNNNVGSAGSIRILDMSHLGDYTFSQSGQGPATAWITNLDLSIGDKKLTTFLNAQAGPVGATPWFPTGKFTYRSLFTPPDSLYDAQGNGELKICYVYTKQLPYGGEYGSGGTPRVDSPVVKFDLTLHNDPNDPEDVYAYDSYVSDPLSVASYPDYRLSVFSVKRSPFPAVNPENFKIRLINLAAKNVVSSYDQLTLCYADGSPVDPTITGVGYQHASDYIELPYGNYQFKVRDRSENIFNEGSSTLFINADGTINTTSGLYYNPLHFYKAGGIYTIAVTWNTFQQYSSSGTGYHYDYPGIGVVQDNTPSNNPNYIKMQAVDALAGAQNVHFVVDGQTFGSLLNFGQASASGIFSVGPHKIQLLDAGGQELAEKMLDNTDPLDNLTVWAFEKDGVAQLITTSNDMSMASYSDDNATGGSANPAVIPDYGWTSRFLNLSDISYVSFLDDKGTFDNNGAVDYTNPDACEHMGIGTYPTDRPAVSFGIGMGQYAVPQRGAVISVYDSPPGTLPGTALPLSLDHPYIANKNLYGAGTLPAGEAGVYTIALIGQSTNSNGGGLKLIVIKHNQ